MALQDLNERFPIVNPDGTPTRYFMSLLRGQTTELSNEIEAAAAWEVLGGVGIDGGGPVSEGVTLDLSDTAVTPGSYTNSNVTVDQQGRITSIANGSSGVSDGDKGDVTVTASGATWTIDNDVVTFAKMQNASAESRLVGRGAGSGAGDFQEIILGTNLSMSGTTLNAAGGGGGSDPWTYIKLASDFTTTSATAVDITGLAFTPVADTQYEFEAWLLLRTNTTTVGPRPGLAWPTGGTDGVATIDTPSSATARTLVNGNINAALLAAVGGLPNTTQSYPALIRGTFRAGATPSGTVKLQLASETAGTTVTAKAYSFLKYRTI